MPSMQTIDKALNAFINADNWPASRVILERESTLLLSQPALDRLIFRTGVAGDGQKRHSYALHVRILLRAHDDGIDAAWRWLEERGRNRKRVEARLEQLRQAGADPSRAQVEQVIASFSPGDAEAFQEMMEEATERQQQTSDEDPPLTGMQKSLADFIKPDSMDESLDILERHQGELLTGEAEGMLTQMADIARAQNEPKVADSFERYAAVLKIAREQGIAAARAFIHGTSTNPPNRPNDVRPPDNKPNIKRADPATTMIVYDPRRTPNKHESAMLHTLLATPGLLDPDTERVYRAWLGETGYHATPEEISQARIDLRDATR